MAAYTVPSGRFPIRPLVADVRQVHPGADRRGNLRNAHGKWMRGVEHQIHLALGQKLLEALGEAPASTVMACVTAAGQRDAAVRPRGSPWQ